MTNLLPSLTSSPGLYRGAGDGPEWGPITARMDITSVVAGRAATLDFEAVNATGLVRVDHCVVSTDERGRPELAMISDELPGIVRFTQAEPGTFMAFEPIKAKIVIAVAADNALTYQWWWARDEAPSKPQLSVTLRRTP